MRKIFVVDTETTGLEVGKHSIWQLAGYYRDELGNLSSVNFKCCPLHLENTTEEALKVSRMTKELLKILPPAKSMYYELVNFFLKISQGEKPLWIGYNCKFDIGMVDCFLKEFDGQDSVRKYFDPYHIDMYEYMKLLRSINFVNPENLKLEQVYRMFGVGTETCHDALQDAEVTYRLYTWAEQTLQKGLNK